MLEFKVQGRGGQGAQTAGEILAHSYFQEGKHVQAYATYGGARRGTPVSAFVRVDDEPIRLRCDIENPDVIVCFDPSLLNESFLKGAKEQTLIVINSINPPDHFSSLGNYRIATIDGKGIAQANQLGQIMNSALVGAFAGALGHPGIETLAKVVADMSPSKKQQNVNACLEGYKLMQERRVLNG